MTRWPAIEPSTTIEALGTDGGSGSHNQAMRVT